jgi:hypothetical protein
MRGPFSPTFCLAVDSDGNCLLERVDFDWLKLHSVTNLKRDATFSLLIATVSVSEDKVMSRYSTPKLGRLVDLHGDDR